MTLAPCITIKNLSASYRQNRVLPGLSAVFGSGQIVHITGRNGSGKTTLLRVISGLHTEYTGTVRVRSQTLQAGDRLPLVSSPPQLFPYLTVREHLTMVRQISLDEGREPGQIDLGRLGLDSVIDSLAEELSLGQRQRLSLSVLLLTDFDIWLLDEPFNGLDEEGVELLRGHIGRHAEAGGLVLVATHSLAHVAGLVTSTVELATAHASPR